MGAFGESIAAWLLFPLAFVAVTVGLGLLAERVLRLRLPIGLRAPLGTCVAIVLVYPAYSLGAGSVVVSPALAVIAIFGLFLGRHELSRRMRPGAPALAAFAVFGLCMAPVVLAGGWTWTGYNFVNDTAVQLLLAEHLTTDGTTRPLGPPEAGPQSTGSEHVRIYLETSYPVGSHSLLAALAWLVPAPLAAVYQPFIALMMALTAAAFVVLARRSGLSPILAGVAGATAAAANLTYHYALQGNVKEIAALAALAAATALGREALTSDQPVRAVAAVAICMAALLSVYSTAGIPYVGALAAMLLLALLLHRDSPLRRRVLPALATGAGVLVAAGLAALLSIVAFGRTATAVFAANEDSGGPDPGEELGHLLRPLELQQLAGVWVAGDYRIPVPAGRELLTSAGIVLVLALALAGVVWLVRRRESGPLLLFGSVVIPLVVVAPRVSHYAEGKLLAIASPAVLLMAAFGVVLLRNVSRLGGYAAGTVAIGAVLLSNAYAYHSIQLAPVERMQDMKQLAERYRDEPGLILVNDFEEFAKYFMRDARVNVATEAITPHPMKLREPQVAVARHFDLDQQRLDYVESFPLIMRRRSPDASRPPASFTLERRSQYYEVWRRNDELRVVEHLPAGGLYRAAGPVECRRLLDMAARSRSGDMLVAHRPPEVEQLDTASAVRSPGWLEHPFIEGAVTTLTPGRAGADLFFRGGRYRVWVQGSFGREVRVLVDGKAVGGVHSVNTPGQWMDAGTVEVRRGRHEAELERSGGGLAPGDGFIGALGPLAFQRITAGEMIRVAPQGARSLCGLELDWVERVRAG